MVRINHCALNFLLDQRLSTIPQNEWGEQAFGYEFTLEFKPHAQNIIVDALPHYDADQGLLCHLCPLVH